MKTSSNQSTGYRQKFKKGLKYHNKPTRYNGRRFMSKKEAEYAQMLDVLRNSTAPTHKVVDVQYQVRFPLRVDDQLIATFILDFIVTYEDGRKEYVDVKGAITEVYTIKKRLFEALYRVKIIEK